MVEPAVIGRCRSLLQYVLKEGMAGAHVIEYAVQDHPKPQAVGAGHQLPKLRFGAEAGVDLKVVQSVVFVVGACGKDGVEIDHIAA